MLRKLFSKKKDQTIESTDNVVISPLKGRVLDISEVPDETFATKMLGEGIAIDPIEGLVCSPLEGEVVQLFLPSKHAVCIKGDNGIEVLVHIGIDTVKMNGEGFEALVNTGDRVSKGQELIRFDIDKVKANAKTHLTPIVITNSFEYKSVEAIGNGSINVGEDLLKLDK